MSKITLADLFTEESTVDLRVGMASGNNIDKTGIAYHVITTAWRKKRLFDMDLAKYLQNLLCELCAKMCRHRLKREYRPPMMGNQTAA